VAATFKTTSGSSTSWPVLEPEIGASEYLGRSCMGSREDRCPAIDLEAEEDLLDLVRILISKRLLSSCSGLFRGRYRCRLWQTHVCWGDIGPEVTLGGMRLDHYLFSESGARMLVSFSPSDLAEVEAMASAGNVAVICLSVRSVDRRLQFAKENGSTVRRGSPKHSMKNSIKHSMKNGKKVKTADAGERAENVMEIQVREGSADISGGRAHG